MCYLVSVFSTMPLPSVHTIEDLMTIALLSNTSFVRAPNSLRCYYGYPLDFKNIFIVPKQEFL